MTKEEYNEELRLLNERYEYENKLDIIFQNKDENAMIIYY